MKFWVRDKNSAGFRGPFDLSEIAIEVKNGRVSESSELLQAEGQSYWALKRATGWRPVQDFIKTEPQALGAVVGSERPIKEPTAKIFISYRREDSHDIVGRIYDRLVEYFSVASVFKDIDDIPLGSDFRRVLAVQRGFPVFP